MSTIVGVNKGLAGDRRRHQGGGRFDAVQSEAPKVFRRMIGPSNGGDNQEFAGLEQILQVSNALMIALGYKSLRNSLPGGSNPFWGFSDPLEEGEPCRGLNLRGGQA